MNSRTENEIQQADPDLGVKQSPVFDTLIVDREASDGSDEPRPEIRQLSPGETVVFRGKEAKIHSTGQRKNNGRMELYRIGFGANVVGTVATLYVDRDPYLLDISNGPIETVDPSEVSVDG